MNTREVVEGIEKMQAALLSLHKELTNLLWDLEEADKERESLGILTDEAMENLQCRIPDTPPNSQKLALLNVQRATERAVLLKAAERLDVKFKPWDSVHPSTPGETLRQWANATKTT